MNISWMYSTIISLVLSSWLLANGIMKTTWFKELDFNYILHIANVLIKSAFDS